MCFLIVKQGCYNFPGASGEHQGHDGSDTNSMNGMKCRLELTSHDTHKVMPMSFMAKQNNHKVQPMPQPHLVGPGVF